MPRRTKGGVSSEIDPKFRDLETRVANLRQAGQEMQCAADELTAWVARGKEVLKALRSCHVSEEEAAAGLGELFG